RAAAGRDAAADVLVESIGDVGSRPHGTRFGTLVHAVLATVDLDGDRATVARVVALHARLVGATDDEVRAAEDVVVNALAHPIMRRAAEAARAGRCRRECPVAAWMDGELVEGVVDAAFLADDAGWTGGALRTDVEIAGSLDAYRRQVRLYADAVTHATGVPARAVLLRL